MHVCSVYTAYMVHDTKYVVQRRDILATVRLVFNVWRNAVGTRYYMDIILLYIILSFIFMRYCLSVNKITET